MIKPEIVPAAQLDLPAIRDLTRRAYGENVPMGFRFVAVRQTMNGLLRDWRQGILWKALLDGALAGTIRLTPRPQGWLYVNRLCVDPPLQGRGLGARLMAFAEGEARRRGLLSVRLDTAMGFAPLVDWYRRQGYVIVSAAKYTDVPHFSVILEKRI